MPPGKLRALGGGDASGVHGEGPSQDRRGRARVERTKNMSSMFVTLDVSKLSGWLNTFANCRVERRAWMWEAVRPGRREGVVGGGDAIGARAEHTSNM